MLRPVLLALVATLVLAGGAQALPGDPPSEPLEPADGASVLVSENPIPVTFTCPVYRTFETGDFTLYGGPSDHSVLLSASPEVGPDGRLADPLSITPGSRGPVDGQCVSALGAGGSPPRVQETPGTYYWQVARLCTGCDRPYEGSAVRRVVFRADAALKVGNPGKVFKGYPVLVPLTLTGLPDGTAVDVMRGSRRAGGATALGGKGDAVVTLPKGKQTLRVRARLGSEELVSPPRTVRVRAVRTWSTKPRDVGTYRSGSVSFKIAARGRQLRAFDAKVPMTCPGVEPGRFTTQIGTATFPRVRIAPDGRFVAARARSGSTMRVRGKLARRKVKGRTELSVGPCVGNAAYSARRR